MTKAKTKAVLVTTAHRGVFFGYIPATKKVKKGEVTLTNVRNCISWSSDVKGFLGLAATGPNRNCRIGASVPEVTLFDITSVSPVTPAAAQAWEAA